MTIDEFGRLITCSLNCARAVEIDGLGVFKRDIAGEVSFERSKMPRVFIAYAVEDKEAAEQLFEEFTAHGFSAWLDRRKLLPGQEWPRQIEDAILSADFFIACFSSRSVQKRGGFQIELRFALNCAHRMPLDDVYLIPVRLDQCDVPARIQRETQYVDLFPDWRKGFESILQIIQRQQLRAA
jgi:hypothetical protein